MITTGYECNKCKTIWRYLPRRDCADPLSNGQCDCGNFICLDNANLIEWKGGNN